MYNILTEILSTPHYCVRPGVFEALRKQILSNIDGHLASGVEKENRLQTFATVENGALTCPQSLHDFKTHEEAVAGIQPDEVEGTSVVGADESSSDHDSNGKQYINILRLSGPMTRGGDACSYGSMDHRDMMIEAADTPGVVAHIIYTHTPGGMASTIRDYRQAINYCHERGQKVYMFCDGDVASGGAFLACLCDEVWANNPEDEIGSLGMYCAFFTLKDGAENKISSEVYRELYADASTDKNGWYRKAADGDMSDLREDLNNDLSQMLANAKQDRPSVKDEQLTGKMYKMGSVKGSLVDSFGSLAELCAYALDEFNQREGAALPRKEQAAAPKKETNTNNNNQNQMKTYTNIAAMIGEEAYESQADGYLALNEAQADALETRAGEVGMMLKGYNSLSEELANANAMVEQLTQELAKAKADLAEAVKTDDQAVAVAELEKGLAEANEALTAVNDTLAAKETELATANAAIAAKEAELQQAHDDFEGKEAELATANQTIADLQQTLATVNAQPSAQPKAGAAPATNGNEVKAPKLSADPFAWNPSLSVAENMKRKREFDEKLKNAAYRAHQ